MAGRQNELDRYRFQCIKAARDLRYPPEAIERIKVAKSDREISNIMKDAIKGYIR